MRPQDLLAESVLASKTLTARYFAGFDDTTLTRQPPGLPNHLAWSLGHLAATMHRVAEKLDGRPFPESDFFKGDGARPAGPGTGRFDTESVAFASKPTGD